MFVLIYIYGGLESQFWLGFLLVFQYYFKEFGVVVFVLNVWGFLGYGKYYFKLDNGFKWEDFVWDIGVLFDWIEQQFELDSCCVVVMGGFYGGYMVLVSMLYYNDCFCCGIDIVGISNFIIFLKNIKFYCCDLCWVEYGDECDLVMCWYLEQIFLMINVYKIIKLMFIVQGQNDFWVLASEVE